jgi:hypothetical protein
MVTVNRLKTILTLLLALFWLPVTMHCGLESLPGIEFLSCCPHDDAASQPAPAHQDNDCETDACATVESGLYKQEDSTQSVSVPLLALAAWMWAAELPADSTPDFSPASSAPPELPRRWQFSYRTALPPRAPSLVA